jgi:hypothetical protein
MKNQNFTNSNKLCEVWSELKLCTVIGIDSLYWFLKKCCFQLYKYCINVPIHVYGVGEI